MPKEAKKALKKELRVAFSSTAQPVWFRVIKYVVIILVLYIIWKLGWLRWFVPAYVIFLIIFHLTYRHKTKKWTQPWGGWSDESILKEEGATGEGV